MASRSRAVVRIRGGTASIDSVNVFRAQSELWQRQRRLRHASSTGSGP
jgi:hypothetical protein